jgi:hypothetical protein
MAGWCLIVQDGLWFVMKVPIYHSCSIFDKDVPCCSWWMESVFCEFTLLITDRHHTHRQSRAAANLDIAIAYAEIPPLQRPGLIPCDKQIHLNYEVPTHRSKANSEHKCSLIKVGDPSISCVGSVMKFGSQSHI